MVSIVAAGRGSPLFRAAYPDGHTESEIDEDGEIELLKKKIDAGADYIVTQLFYDVDGFLRWERKVREKGASNY